MNKTAVQIAVIRQTTRALDAEDSQEHKEDKGQVHNPVDQQIHSNVMSLAHAWELA